MERTYPTNPGDLAKELMRRYPDVFTVDFEENRALVKKMIVTQSKSLRNEVAGHISRMKVREATGQYREEMDVIGEFVNQSCEISPDATATAAELYERYLKWCEKNGEKPVSQKMFGRKLGERGFRSKRITKGPQKGRHHWEGVGLTNSL